MEGSSIINDDKLFYTISEVAQELGVSETLLRYWEKEFPTQIKPKKYAYLPLCFTTKKGNAGCIAHALPCFLCKPVCEDA